MSIEFRVAAKRKRSEKPSPVSLAKILAFGHWAGEYSPPYEHGIMRVLKPMPCCGGEACLVRPLGQAKPLQLDQPEIYG